MKAILYCRKSSESEDRQVMSLDAQETELRKKAESLGIEIVKTYRESMSAKAPGRLLFTEMIKLLSEGEADSILTWKLDRLARNPIDGGSISWLLQQGQIKSIQTHERQYLPSDSVLLMSVEFGMSNQFVRDLSENVKRGNREKLRRGEWPNNAPYGYRNDRNTRTLVIHPEEAKNVHKMFEMYATGMYSLKQIADELGVFKSIVDRVLHKTFYYGLMERRGEFYPGIHEPIITQQLFEQAKAVRERTTRPVQHTLMFPYRGLMLCAECGCQLTASRKKGVYDYYYCTNGKGNCSQHKSYLTDSDATAFFVSALEKIQFPLELVDIIYEAKRESLQNDPHDKEKVLADIDLAIQQITRKERKLLDAYTSELIDEPTYRDEVSLLKQSKESLNKKKVLLSQNSQDPSSTLELVREIFIDSNRAVFEFKNAEKEQRNKIANKVLWNLSVADKNVAQYNYKTYYETLANAPKNGDLTTMLAVWDDIGTFVLN